MLVNFKKYAWFMGAVLTLFGLIAPSSQALEVKGLYQAEVPVKTQERAERLDVYPGALSQVIVKLSGDRTVPELLQLEGIISSARSMVQQYHYRKLPEEGYLALKEEGYRYLLVVRFDGETLTQSLVKAGIPLWGSTRPEVLLWLAVEDREARYLLATNASLELEASLNDFSRRRGLPLLLPLLDLEDQMHLGYADVWGDFRQTILDASQRYGADAVLVGRLYRPFDGPWQARWSLYHHDDVARWKEEGLSQEQVLAGGIEGASDRLAQRYAQLFTPETEGQISLTVTDINGLASYARTKQYLESLDVVAGVQVTEVFSDEVLFKLDMRGDLPGLERAIGLGNTLRRVAGVQQFNNVTAESEAAGNKAIIYQLLP